MRSRLYANERMKRECLPGMKAATGLMRGPNG